MHVACARGVPVVAVFCATTPALGYGPWGPRATVVEALLAFSRLVADFPEIAEAEINPLRALPEGQGAVALDARIRVAKPAG